VSGVGDIVRAMKMPPTGSRAAVRGRLIQKWHARAGDASAYWGRVSVRSGNKRADLSDPFCRKAVWTGTSVDSRAGPINRCTAAEHEIGRTIILRRPVFVGSYQLRLDLRGRLTLPTQWRPVLGPTPQSQVMMVVNPDACLVLWPESRSRTLLAERRTTGSVTGDQDEVRPIVTPCLTTNMHVAPLDARGRLTIPTEFRRLSHLGQEVMAVGCLLSVEVWSIDRWKALEATLPADFPHAARRLGL
jgi:division/cell wall cluster transcriptional repressor MraZ